jgi:AraC-like DNA-binding protein
VPYKSKKNPKKSKTKTFVNQLGFAHCQPGYIWDSRMFNWKDYDLWIFLGGSGILQTSKNVLEISRGDCLTLRPRKKYIFKNNIKTKATLFYIHYNYLDDNMNIVTPDKTKLPPFYLHIDDIELLSRLITKTHAAYKKNNIEDYNFWFEAILKETNGQYQKNKLSSSRIKQRWIFNALCEEIDKYPGNSYRVSELAKKLHYNYQYFSRLFKKYSGMPPSEFLIQTRIKAAKRLLRMTDDPIGRIADILNYNDSYSFSKQFHKKTGATPSEYRKLVNKSHPG